MEQVLGDMKIGDSLAVERAGTRQGNNGWAAALTGIEMANLLKVLPA